MPPSLSEKTGRRTENRGVSSLRVKDSDMEKIQSEVAELFKDIMTKELVENGYQIADAPSEDVLLIKPAIVDLDVYAPDIPGRKSRQLLLGIRW